MTEILTESFCERCGTRYTFETARPRSSRLGRARTLTKGLRNFVLSDDPLSVAMADARSEEERSATALQLDAFHKTFNFCLSCRQYTCGNCWNVEEGRCLSCSPRSDTASAEPTETVDSAAVAERLAAMTAASAPAAHDVIGVSAWPEADLPRRAPELASLPVVAAPEPDTASARALPEPSSVEAASAEPLAAKASAPEVQPVQSLAPEVEAVAPEVEAVEAEAGAVEFDAVEAEVEAGAPEVEAIALETAEQSMTEAAQFEGVAVRTEPAEVEAVTAEAVEPESVGAEGAAVQLEAVEQVEAEVPAMEPAEAIAVSAVVSEAAPIEPVAAELVEQAPAVETETVGGEPLPLEPDPLAGEPAAVPQLHGVRVGESLDQAIAAYEASLLAREAEAARALSPAPALEDAAAEAELVAATTEAAVDAEPLAQATDVAEPEAVAELVAEPAELAEGAPEPEAVAELVAEPAELAEVVAEPEAPAEPEAVEAQAAAVQPAAEPQTDRLVPEPEPVAAAAIAPEAAPQPPVEPAPAQPSSPAPASMAPGWLTVAPDDGAAPAWPQRPTWPASTRRPLEGATLAGRRMMPTSNAAALWAASAREVLETGPLADQATAVGPSVAPSAQPCIGCGLPLSANARFCRRCGSRQD